MTPPTWRLGMRLVLRTDRLGLPPDWPGDDAADPAADGHAAHRGSAPALTVFREQETRRLEDIARALGGEARAARTMHGLRNPALKALWWLASRGHGGNPPRRPLYASTSRSSSASVLTRAK